MYIIAPATDGPKSVATFILRLPTGLAVPMPYCQLPELSAFTRKTSWPPVAGSEPAAR